MGSPFTPIRLGIARKAMSILAIAMMSGSQPFARTSDQSTEIRVQIVDSRTHRPLKGRRVQITFSGMDGQWYHNAPTMKGRTGSDGVLVLEVKQPVPPRMDVFVWWAYPCSFPEDFSTQEVLKEGMVGHWPPSRFKKAEKWCTADSDAPLPQRRPGEVIFFIHPMNWFVWVWYDTWE
jgi:hypothetical protein